MNNLPVWHGLRARSLSQLVSLLLCFMGVMVFLMGNVTPVYGCELKESSSSEAKVFRRHLIGSCTSEERERFAISTDVLFQALHAEKSLDLLGVTIVGDLLFDQLPLQPMNGTSLISDAAQQIVAERRIQSGRIIPGSLSIRDSVIHGNWATNLRDGLLMIVGDVLITGTTFKQSMDFSKTAFLGTVNFTHSSIQYEGFFIGAHFEKEAIFEGVSFGTHSRFHKARFRQNANFFEGQFNGLAEFLEVEFEKRANFAQAQFQMGTGFSGTQFHGPSDFSQSKFTRETFFRFAIFQQDANFQDAIFREVSDFTSAKFAGNADFENVEFLVSPNFSETGLEGKFKKKNKNKFVSEYLAVGLAFLGFLCILLWGVKKWRYSSS